jgi:hypothetical protein
MGANLLPFTGELQFSFRSQVKRGSGFRESTADLLVLTRPVACNAEMKSSFEHFGEPDDETRTADNHCQFRRRSDPCGRV